MPYLDFNATAPLHPAARQAWLEAADRAWHNPSSLYPEAAVARQLFEEARERLADMIGCDPGRIVFTSGATEANNALARHVGRTAGPRARAVLSAIEHPCVAEAFAAALPGRILEADVDGTGAVQPGAVDAAIAAGSVACVSVMAASNETGVIQPWEDIAAACRRRGVPFHTDAAQWFGKLPAAALSRCDWITGSGHKFGGPKGVGFLVVPEDDTANPSARGFQGDRGGPQESGRRAGTENVAAIAAMVAALEAADARVGEAARLRHAENRRPTGSCGSGCLDGLRLQLRRGFHGPFARGDRCRPARDRSGRPGRDGAAVGGVGHDARGMDDRHRRARRGGAKPGRNAAGLAQPAPGRIRPRAAATRSSAATVNASG
jgi:cysteine sulfinate desulfinase/cysteine desulfurase-like protein